jgi:predicted protein tyrosine phosphatase
VRVTSYLELGEKVVVCCSHGMNRSNAIALGVLVQYFKMDLFKALELIKSILFLSPGDEPGPIIIPWCRELFE